MKKISIKKNGIVTNEIQMENEQADAWLQSHIGMGTFGKAAYSYQQELTPAVYEDGDEILDENQESFDPPQYEQVLISEATYETIEVPAEYEVIEEDTTAQAEKQALIADKRAKGKAAADACNSVLELIGGFNIDRELTFEQKNEMKVLFANANDALKERQPGYAKYFINSITPDGVLLTQEMKDLCIELLANY